MSLRAVSRIALYHLANRRWQLPAICRIYRPMLSRFRPVSAAVLMIAFVASVIRAADAGGASPLRFDGDLSGDFTPTKFPGAPTVHWKISLHPAEAGAHAGEFTVDGTGTRIRGDA